MNALQRVVMLALLLSLAVTVIADPDGRAESPAARSLDSLELAVKDLIDSFGSRYRNGQAYLTRISRLRAADSNDPRWTQQFDSLRNEALLANPLLDFDQLLIVQRGLKSPRLGLPANWQGNASLPRGGYDDRIVSLSPVKPDGALRTVHEPAQGRFVGDVDLHFDAGKVLYSSTDDHGRWRVFELTLDQGKAAPIRQIDEPDIDNYDACYLPDGGIIFSSTATMQGVPCVNGGDPVANLYLLSADGKTIRRLTFEQDHDWCPIVMPSGQVLYLRWEYSDLPHAFARILMRMNPDGTGQTAVYGSNSYWPNSLFYARPVPGDSRKFVGVVSGHHGVARQGELVLFDATLGQREAEGAVQRIGARGQQVKPIIKDELVDASWPRFLHPWPLSDKYFITSCQLSPSGLWGVYLVDVFDNFVLLKELPGYALLEPTPLRAVAKPPVIPSRVDLSRSDATVYIEDLYRGPGLHGVPRGQVKALRLVTYHFAHRGVGGQQSRVGLDGPWDIKRVIGTVPVRADGSAHFRIPAHTPISLQPLDEDGKAMQLMRSWFTAMPGERVSCVGCHETASQAATSGRATLAALGAIDEVTPWPGPAEGFSFERQVQPVLDRHCIGCHGGSSTGGGAVSALPDFRRAEPRDYTPAEGRHGRGVFSPAYFNLRRFVRTPTIEGDLHLLTPMAYHADTTRIVQLLRRGHHGVKLDDEAWRALIAWIDLHAPYHGTWNDVVGDRRFDRIAQRRCDLALSLGGAALNAESSSPPPMPAASPAPPPAVPNVPVPAAALAPAVAGWPFAADEARRRQCEAAGEGTSVTRTFKLAEGVTLEMVLVPAGQFVMTGLPQSRPTPQRVDRPFWMSRCEIDNALFRRFDASHQSRLEPGDFLHFSQAERGFPLDEDRQPAVFVSQLRARSFCQWLSQRTGRRFDLPSAAQWEYACRAGSSSPMSFGTVENDFSADANLADHSFAYVANLSWNLPRGAVPLWRPAIERYNDGARVSARVGTYRPNTWGLYDMHGNVAEWTNDAMPGDPTRVLVAGGSWYDRPCDATAAARQPYRDWQRVFDVGFRVVCDLDTDQGAGHSTQGISQ